MMFTVKFATGTAAFGDNTGQEIARILEEAAEEVRKGRIAGPVMDLNGTKIGWFNFNPFED